MSNDVRRVVNTRFWDDDKVINEFSPEDKYFMLYLLTNKHTTQLGIYTLVPKQAAFELGYSVEAVHVLLDRFERKYGIIRYSDETSEVAIRNYLFHSIIKGGRPVMDCLLKEEKDVADRYLLWFILDGLERKQHTYPKKMNGTVLEYMEHLKEERSKEENNIYKEDIQLTLNINDNDNDNERYVDESYHESSPSRKLKRFNPPSAEDVDSYCLEKNLEYVNPNAFVEFYGSKNWMVGKNKMTNWHMALSGWNRRSIERGEKKYVRKDKPTTEAKHVYANRPERWRTCPESTWQKLKPFASDDGSFDWGSFDSSVLNDYDREWMRQNNM